MKMPSLHCSFKNVSLVTAFSLLCLLSPASAQQPAGETKTALPTESTTIPSDRNYAPRLNYKTQMEDYLATMKGKPVDLVFIGDSITEQWRWGTGKPVWDKYYATRALDFGLGSDKTQNTVWRLKNLPLDGFAPKVAVILIGTNKQKDTPENIAAGVRAVIDATRDKFSGIKIVLVSILPNARATSTMAAANTFIEKIADRQTVFYLDLAANFIPEGTTWKGLGGDKLHLSTAGYELWASELNQLLPLVFAGTTP